MTSSTRGLLVVEADDADRGRHRDALALERQAPLADRLEHALGDALRGVAVGVAQQDGELVAAEAGDHVGLADAVVQRAADRADDLVAGLVAAGVVDVLEAVEVEQEDRALAAVARGVGDVLGELLVEAATVEELRQRVVVGEVLQLVLEALALRDVADDAGHDDAVVGVQHREHDVDRELGAVLALAPQLEAHAEGDLRVALGRRQHGGEALGDQRAGALGEELLDRAAQDLLAVVAEQLVGPRVGEADRAVLVDLDDRVRRGLEDGLELLLGLLALGDVADDAAEEARAGGLPHRERELERELAAVLAQADDLDGLADQARGGHAALGDALDAGVVHRAEALGHQDRERLADDLVLDVAEHQLGAAVPGDDVAVLVGGDDRVVGGLGDRAEAALGLAQRVGELLAGDQAAELAADVRGDLEQAVVRRDGLQREALDDGEGLVADRDREGEGTAQADLGAGLGAREVGVAGDIDDPGGAAGGRRRGPEGRCPRASGVRSASAARNASNLVG